jgi:hypothetical protein
MFAGFDDVELTAEVDPVANTAAEKVVHRHSAALP